MILKRSERPAREAPADSLLSLAASLDSSAGSDAFLTRLTTALTDRGVSCAVLLQTDEPTGFQLERTTLPFTSNAWSRSLALPRLAAVVNKGRPVFQSDPSAVFAEKADSGSQRSLLTENVEGPLAIAPLRAAGRAGVLCLASPDLDDDSALPATWALAVQLSAVLRSDGSPAVASSAAGGDLPLFHELTRRLSFTLSPAEVVSNGIEVLGPALGLQLAVAVTCRNGEHATAVHAPRGITDAAAASAADGALAGFLKLAGAKHRDCVRGEPAVSALDAPAPSSARGAPSSVLDAPLVTQGQVIGLLRAASWDKGAFDETKEQTFYTVANQLSLALDRITSQQQAERAHLASLAESLSDGIVLVDASLRVTSLNSAAAELVALEEGAAVGDTLATLAQEALSQRAPTALRELAERNAGSRRYLVAMAAPLAGSPEGSAAVLIVRDVTDERLMQERLLQSEKMVSVGQLVSGVAHELNNPLTGIMGFAQLLLGRSELDETTRRDVETIHQEADRAAKIVQNLLSFARRKRTAKELVNLNVLIERVLELRGYELRVKNIEVELDLDPNLPDTMADANQIQQVFFNVVMNAEQAILSIRDLGTLKIRSRRDGDAIRVSFEDDGPGMPPETLRRIFDPFYTTKDTGEGTGLGLTISYGIIDEHGGRIWADSHPDRGTTFFIELPVVQGAGAPAPPREEEPEAAVPAHAILVVDDEESIQRLLGSVLQMDGHQVDVAGNGREALERIAARDYDMVITDIKMPGMSGAEFYERLLGIDSKLAERTVFITGDTVSPDTRNFLDRVSNPCLSKPFRVREVRDTIARVLGD